MQLYLLKKLLSGLDRDKPQQTLVGIRLDYLWAQYQPLIKLQAPKPEIIIGEKPNGQIWPIAYATFFFVERSDDFAHDGSGLGRT